MTDPLWRWPELCAALGLEARPGPDISGFCIDSRLIEAGDLFIALTGDPGPRFNPSQRSDRDGHDFVDSALANGAAGVLTHDATNRACPELKVVDTLDGLWALGAAARTRLRCPVVAVTGSSGKTTTKSLLTAALGAFSTPGSLNNHLGVPLSLVRTPRAASAAVYEIGTSHPGEISPLAELVQPDVAVVLNVHPAHAEYFTDLFEIRTEKLSIYNGLGDSGVLVVKDEIDTSEVPTGVARLCFGRSKGADVRLLALTDHEAQYEINGQQRTAHVPGGGAHRALSVAAVLTVCQVLRLDPEPALQLSDDLVPTGRGNRLEINGIMLIDDSYNANPASMVAALRTLQSAPGRKFALLGEMLELGDASAQYHQELALLCERLDGVFCVGKGMQALVDVLPAPRQDFRPVPDDSLLRTLTERLQRGDTLLIKGSNRVFWARDYVAQIARTLAS